MNEQSPTLLVAKAQLGFHKQPTFSYPTATLGRGTHMDRIFLVYMVTSPILPREFGDRGASRVPMSRKTGCHTITTYDISPANRQRSASRTLENNRIRDLGDVCRGTQELQMNRKS